MQATGPDETIAQLTESSAEVSEIVFFLLGAMTIVEIVDAHQGFKLITNSITSRKPRTLLWVVWYQMLSISVNIFRILSNAWNNILVVKNGEI